jgi:hypothetical protein
LRYDSELERKQVIAQLVNTVSAFCGTVRLIAVLTTPVAEPHDVNIRINEDDTKDFDQTVTVLYVIEKILHILTASLNKLQRNIKIYSYLK